MTFDENLYRSSKVVTRYDEPILTPDDVPFPSSLTFNAGIIKTGGKYVMLFRNDYGVTAEEFSKGKHFEGTNIGYAESSDGIHFKIDPKPRFAVRNDEILRVYDPRITELDGRFYVAFAADTRHGIRGAIYEATNDFKDFELLSMSTPDNRNMVIFPEKINGNFVRLERPMPVYSRGRDCFDIWLSDSPDLRYWGNPHLVLGVEDVPYCNDKIGPAAPPLKTDRGWLCIFHAVDLDTSRGKNGWEGRWQKRYCIGIILLDLKNPQKVIGMSKVPLMVPEAPYEISGGFRDNALFPCAMVEEGETVRIYYSAGDREIRLASAKLSDLLALCTDAR